MTGNTKMAIDLNKAFTSGADMSSREKEILEDIVSKTDFLPEKVIWRSTYWGTNQVGAVHYLGIYKNDAAVLKIQGVKPDVSEIFMIEQFALQNRSKIVRPPILFHTIPWNEENGYEALIMEHVSGAQVLESKKLESRENIKKFLNVYLEYRNNCLPLKPWLPKPDSVKPEDAFGQLWSTSQKAYPEHPFRKTEDHALGLKAYQTLFQVYKDVPMEFVHGHISMYDLVRKGSQVVLFSNLFWKWKFPFYDLVFGFHWFLFELEHVEGINPIDIDQQRDLWNKIFFDLPGVRNSEESKKLLKAALLERAVSGLIIDSFLMDKNKPIVKYLNSPLREQVIQLTKEIAP